MAGASWYLLYNSEISVQLAGSTGLDALRTTEEASKPGITGIVGRCAVRSSARIPSGG